MEDKEKLTAVDFLGNVLAINDFVIASQGHELAIYRIMKITPKMVRVVKLNAKTRQAKKGKLRYSNELFKIDEQIVTYYLMKQ